MYLIQIGTFGLNRAAAASGLVDCSYNLLCCFVVPLITKNYLSSFTS